MEAFIRKKGVTRCPGPGTPELAKLNIERQQAWEAMKAKDRFSFRAKMASVFDRLNPPLTHFHTKPELEDWCRRARLTDWQVVNRDGRGWLVWGRPA